jgi:hypothetical protein
MRKLLVAAFCAAILCPLALGTCSNGMQGYPSSPTAMLPQYRLFVDPDIQHGTLSLSTYLAPEGTDIRAYVNPDPGYRLVSNSVQWHVERQGAMPDPMLSFGYYYHAQLGSGDRVVTAAFEPVTSGITVSVDRNIANGIIAANPVNAASGSTVTLYSIPKAGYVLMDGSITIQKADGSVTTLPESAAFPYTFTLPDTDVRVSATFVKPGFSGYLAAARKYARAGQFDSAASCYEQAWQLIGEGTGDDVQEVIFYSSLARLGSILTEPSVRTLFKSFNFDIIPTTLDDWICDPATWAGVSGEQWYDTWDGQQYDTATTPPGSGGEPFWAEGIDTTADWARDIDYESRDMTLPNRYSRISGFHVSLSDTTLFQGMNPKSPQKFFNILLWSLIAGNPNGFNDLLQTIDTRLFGTTFKAAADRAALLSDSARVELHQNLKTRFGLDKYYGAGDTRVGKAELNYIFGVLWSVKAAVQFIRAYDWAIDLRPWTGLPPTKPIEAQEGLDQILDDIFFDVESSKDDRWAGYWRDAATVAKILPLKNRDFLAMRDESYLGKAKDSLSTGLAMINSAMTTWFGSAGSSNFSDEARANYRYAQTGFSAAQTALSGGGVFYFSKLPPLPSPSARWPARTDSDYGVDTTELFVPGAFSPQNFFTTEMKGAAPSLFKIRWYEDGQGLPVLPTAANNQAALVTEPITDDGAETVGTYSAPYGIWTFEMNTGHLRKIFPHGFEQNRYVRKTGDQAYLYEVFPTIPLWPARPTYFTGKDGRRTAKNLYKYYHDIK